MEDFRIRVFMAVYEAGSFTKAAAGLGISQPAVSQNVAELERMLGTSLFVRSGGRVSVTPAGELFRSFASRVEDAYRDIRTVFMTPVPDGTACKIYADAVAREYLFPEISRILGVICPSLGIGLAATQQGADISILSAPVRHPDGVTFTFHVCPSSHPLSPVLVSIIRNMLETR